MKPVVPGTDIVDLLSLWQSAREDGDVTESEVDAIVKAAAEDAGRAPAVIQQSLNQIDRLETRSVLNASSVQAAYPNATPILNGARRQAALATRLRHQLGHISDLTTRAVEHAYRAVSELVPGFNGRSHQETERLMEILSRVPSFAKKAMVAKLESEPDLMRSLYLKTAVNPRLQAFLFAYMRHL